MCTCDEEDLCCKFDEIDSSDNPQHPSHAYGGNLEDLVFSECSTSKILTISPSCLRFPYNDNQRHIQKITFWNRTQSALQIRLKSSKPEVFEIEDALRKSNKRQFRATRQLVIFGLAATTLLIRCTPGSYKMGKFFIKVYVYKTLNLQNICECLQVPLEIYPSTTWFNLPKSIVLPDVTIGRKAHALITLPQPIVSERYFVTFSPNFTKNVITMYPMHGTIGGEGGIKQLRITYAPTEFTTVSCSIAVHFPGLSTTTSHEIKILARCRPGNEIDAIRKEIEEIESFLPKPIKKKKPFKLKFRSKLKLKDKPPAVADQSSEDFKKPLSLFTLAGVQHFLLSKEDVVAKYKETDSNHGTRTEIEKLAAEVELADLDKYKIYMDIKRRLGLDFDEGLDYEAPHAHAYRSFQSYPDIHEHRSSIHPQSQLKLTAVQRKQWAEFENTVGTALLGRVKELPKHVEVLQPSIQSVARTHKSINQELRKKQSSRSAPQLNIAKPQNVHHLKVDNQPDGVSKEEKKMFQNINDDVQLDLTPKQKFIQAVLITITRQRVNIRLLKIRQLVQEIRNAKRKLSKGARSSKSGNSVLSRGVKRTESKQRKTNESVQSKAVNAKKQSSTTNDAS